MVVTSIPFSFYISNCALFLNIFTCKKKVSCVVLGNKLIWRHLRYNKVVGIH
jgi:hypothetical protein